MSIVSPAVERAAVEAKRLAGDALPHLGHWLLALTADDDGKPASLIGRAGLDLANSPGRTGIRSRSRRANRSLAIPRCPRHRARTHL